MNSLLRFTLAFIAGVLLASKIPLQTQTVFIFCGIFLFFSVLFLALKSTTKTTYLVVFRGLSLLLLALGLGFGCTLWHDETRFSNHIIHQNLDLVTHYQAEVIGMPESRAKTYKVEAVLRVIRSQEKWQESTGKIVLYLDKKAMIPKYGDVLLVRGAPRRAQPPLNPEEFDYAQFLRYKQFYHTHYLRSTDFVFVGKNNAVWYKSWAYRLSQWADNQLKRLMPWPREYTVAKAMVLGIRGEMDTELTDAYSVAGAVHVLSVSGFHIAIFVWILSTVLAFLEKRKYGRWLYLLITLGTMWFYAVLTGLSAPVIRSALMFTIYLMAKPLHRKENTANALFGSALILLCFDPQLIYSVSFQLSYTALGGIIFLQPRIYQGFTFENWLIDKIWNLTAVALAAQLTTFPLLVYYFHQLSTYFWLANPFVIWLSFALLPLALATVAFSWVPYLAQLLGWLTTLCTWILNETVLFIEHLPFSRMSGLWFDKMEVILVYAIIGFLLELIYFRNKKWLWLALFSSVGLFGLQYFEIKQTQKQQLIVVHNVAHQTVLSLIDGQKAWILADSIFFHQPRGYDFYLDNFYIKLHIAQATQVAWEASNSFIKPLPFGKLVVWNNKKIVIVEQPIARLPIKADVVVVANSAYRDVEKVVEVFGNQPLVFDASNKNWIVEKLANTTLYLTPKQGAWLREY